MFKRLMVCTATCLLLMLGSSSVLAANLITNGDFETGDLTGWSWTPTQYSDPNMTTAVVSFDTSGSGASLAFRVSPGTDNGHAAIGQQEGGYLSQSVSLTNGQAYDVAIGASAIQEVSGIGGNADGGLIRLYVAGNLLWSWDVAHIDQDATLRNSYSGAYTAGFTGAHDVEIWFTRTYMNWHPGVVVYQYLDEVLVDDSQDVPEPTTLVMLALAGAGLAIRKRLFG